jgi:membrane-associated phospholipid phosphatase
MKKLVLILSILLSAPALRASSGQPADSSAFRGTQLIAPGVLVGSSLAIHYFAHDSWDLGIKEWAQDIRGGAPVVPFDDYIQYAPFVMDLGLGLLGAEAKHGFTDRLIETALGSMVCAALSLTCKEAFHTLRPNGYDYRSFPSGHSDTVFLGAELVRMEYGWGWGAGAYAIACTVGSMRIYRNWHWFSDVLFGAGIGILSAHAGQWLLSPTKRILGIDQKEAGISWTLAPSYDPLSGALCSSVTVRF